MSGAEPDKDISERWRSFQYRKMMGVSVEQYDETPALTVDWDMALARVENQVEASKQPK